MSNFGYAYDAPDTLAGHMPGTADAASYYTPKGGMMTKTQLNTISKHVAIAAIVIWAVTKFI